MPALFRSTTVCTAALLATTVSAQLGGQAAFRLLDIPASARAAALGGNYLAVKDADLNLGIYNPALLDSATGQQIALSYLPYFDGIKVGYAAYAHHLDSARVTLAASVQYLDYGTFQRTDEVGEVIGEFRAGEQVFQVGAGYPIDSTFSVGANLKYLNSALDTYRSSAWGVDLAGVFHKRKLGLTIAGAVRNIGAQLTTYTEVREKLPMQMQLGITYKFRHAPFRLGLMMEQLQRWDLTYEDPNAQVTIDPTTGEVIEEKVTLADKAILHLVPSAEILLSRSFMLRVAYNVRRRQELVIPDKPSAVGLSFGVGLRVSKFHIAYGFSQMHLAGISNTLSLGMRFADFKRAAG
ncbi:MAG: type IX secretion system protein PorQ [Flavobacteriales bacterium]|nr:type IX secretion system protein PorQ [Flavobacteriales bacterium]